MNIKNNLDKIVILAGIVLFVAIGYINQNKVDSVENEHLIEESIDEPEEEIIEDSKIQVDISGCIANPGVYELNYGDRINDLVNQAGGLCSDADIEAINLSKKLEDEMKVHIYKIGETPSNNQPSLSNDPSLININTASKEELMTLPGIGESRANEIISYRKDNPFKEIEDIKNISGIGDKTFEKLKEYISIN